MTPKQKAKQDADRIYALARLMDSAPKGLILAEMVMDGLDREAAEQIIDAARDVMRRAFDEDDIQQIREAAFAADSLNQKAYRERIAELRETQAAIRAQYDGQAPTKNLVELELAVDRSIQSFYNLAHRGRRDLAVAFAPKEVLERQTPPTDDDLDDAIDGSL